MATNPYGVRDAVYVLPFPNSGVRYGFLTTMGQAEKTQLGHLPVTQGNVFNNVGALFGINAPKPARVGKITAGKGHQSSFCDHTKLNTAITTQGWRRLDYATFRRAYPTKLTKAVYVEAAAPAGTPFKYTWRMPLWQYNLPTIQTDKARLGITDCDPNVRNYVWGADKHQPPQAQYQAMPQGGKVRTYTTFVAWNKIDNLPNGWIPKRQKNQNRAI